MKRNGKNIITSNDVTVLGKNSGKSLEEVLENLLNDSDSLKSNVKWLYKYGGVGGNGGGNGGGPTITDKWTVVCSLGNILIPETTEGSDSIKSILFSSAGNYKLYIHINNPAGDTYSAEFSYNGGKSIGRATLNSLNRWTYEGNINLLENNTIHVSIMNGNMLEKTFDATHIINAYTVWSYLAKNNGDRYPTFQESGVEKYNLFIDDIKELGLKFVTKYTASVNIPVTYYYTKFGSTEEVREVSAFHQGDYDEILLEVDALDNLQELTNNDASALTFLMKLNIDNREIVLNISADLLPSDLYLKIVPADEDIILYNQITDGEHQILITGNKTFNITPYNGKLGGTGKVKCTYKINDVDVADSNTSLLALDNISPGTGFLKTFVLSKEEWNKLTFRAEYGDTYKDFVYYLYTQRPSETVNWFNDTKPPFSSAFYRYGDSAANQVKLSRNGILINPTTYISKNANDILENEVILSSLPTHTQELMINIGILYNYINDEEKEIIEIPTLREDDTNSLHIYLNKFLIGASSPKGQFFLEEEEKYNISEKNNYHLITIARKYIRSNNLSNHLYELSIYIDGVLLANTVSHINPSEYNSFILKNGNYSINLLDITYFNNRTITETDVVQYWYAYQTRLKLDFTNIGEKSNLLNIFNKFNIEHLNDSEDGLYTGHVYVIESTLMDLIQNVRVPVMVIEYEPNANKDENGNPMQFLTPPTENVADGWSDKLYTADAHDSIQITVGIKWANGTGTADTRLEEVDTTSIPTPDGQQRSAKFTLDILGSTTRSYRSKNYTLGIEFTDSADSSYIPIFTPWFNMDNKSSFLPENSFTLKSDVVDSSHTNNTCMGKFINDNTTKFEGAKQILSPYSDHIKNCLGGFPCLIFVHSSGSTKYYYLGIYNFNLGRTSNFNLGYSDLRALPQLTSTNHRDFRIYSVPRTTTGNIPGAEIKNTIVTAEIDFNRAWYDFSLYDDSILYQLPDRPNDKDYMFDEIVSGMDSGTNLTNAKAVIKEFVRRTSRSGGYVFDKIEKGFHDDISKNYTVTPGYVPNARILYRRVKDSEILTFEVINLITPGSSSDFSPIDLINYIYSHTENDLDNVAPYANYKSIVEYYTTCMGFGLLDSVLKNLNIKSWNGGNTFYLAFYDMDTCLGINNEGYNVSYYAFSDYWENALEEVIDHDSNGTNIILAQPISVYRDYAPDSQNINLYDVPSSYIFAIAKYARSVIEYYKLASSESNISLDSLKTPLTLWAEWRGPNGVLKNSKNFIDLYYNGYMEGINELMFNYNFRMKYFDELPSGLAYSGETKRFRGRSIGYLRDWLDKRFHMLDAYFNLAGNLEIFISDGANYNKTNKNSESYDPNYSIVYEQYPVGLLSYSNDVNIDKSIFGLNPSHSGDIDVIVQAPDYTPIIVKVGQGIYRYLLLESSNKYNIRIPNTGTNKLVFGGSSMWTYLESIDSFAAGDITLTSDKLLILRGSNGQVNSWTLDMPALREVHLNGQNYAGDLVFSRDSNFYNLTEIDISNSKINLELDNQVVREINLTNIKSGKVDIQNCNYIENILFNNSLIADCSINEVNYLPLGGTLTLNGNSIRKLDITGKDSLNLKLRILNDQALTTLIVRGFTEVYIENCSLLTSITTNGDKLQRILTLTCPKIKDANINVTNCSYIRIHNAELGYYEDSGLTLRSSTDFSTLQTLLIPLSKINKIHYKKILGGNETEINISSNNVLDLRPLVNLDNLDVLYNSTIEYIYFTNDIDHPIPIRNHFIGCLNLRRIYGYINIVNTNLTFYNLQLFSIHGPLNTSWKNLAKTKNLIVLTPMLLISGEQDGDSHGIIIGKYETVTKQSLFQEGDAVTNITFDLNMTGSFNYFIWNTNTTLFDVYYLLNAFGLSNVNNNVTIGIGAFCSKNSMFNYANGNLFNRYTFYKCSKITSLSGSSYSIFNTEETLWYSPTVTGNTVTIDNGLFSPLTNLTNITRFSGTACMSRFVLRKSSGKYPLTSLHWQGIGLIHDDIDNYSTKSLLPTFYVAGNPGTITSGQENKLGNVTDFFKDTNISSITNTFNAPVINYNTLTIPNTITLIYASFNISYGFGTFDWNSVFNDSNYNKLTIIANAFNLTNYLDNHVLFKIFAKMFLKMPNLEYLGYRYDGANNGGYTDNPASNLSLTFTYGFHGNGYSKILELENGGFPYSITSYISKIKSFCGIFSELYVAESAPSINIDFPGDMFLNTPLLENITALFADCRIPLNSLTPKGFRNCRNLKNVSRLFYTGVSANNDVTTQRVLSRISIPNNFFYIGELTGTNVYYGTNDVDVMNEDIAHMENPETGTPFDITDPSNKAEVPFKLPLKSILFGSECFHGLDKMTYYLWDKTNFNITDYPNNNYIPFAYYKTNDNVWHTRPNDPKYTKLYDISSVYDGNPDNLEVNAYCKDSDNVVVSTSTGKASIVNYFCPPDILNSFINADTTNICGMFKWCGPGDNSNSTYRRRFYYPIPSCYSGRICPYLFDTVSNIKYLTEFFYNFKGLTSYLVDGDGTYYLIPPKLFESANKVEGLANTFAGIFFDVTPNYTFLSTLINVPIDVRGIFSCCMYNSNYSITRIFLSNTLSNASGAFCVRPITLTTDDRFGVSASTANPGSGPYEPNNCTFTDNLASSKNSLKKLTRTNTGYTYYGVGNFGASGTVTDSVIYLDFDYNLHN